MRACLALVLCAGLAFGPRANAQNTTVRLLSPVSAGSGADALARIVAEGLANTLGQSVVVENKPGADGAIAARAAAAAPADGRTLLFGGTSTYALTLNMKPPPFAAADLVAASTVGRITYGLFVHPDVPSRDLREFIAHARSHPGRLNFGSVNLATEIAAAHLMRAGGIELVKVPYKGGGQVMGDLVAGRVQVFFGPVANGLSHARAGRLRLVATHPERSRLAPNVPTLAEGGLDIAFRPLHYMLLLPGATPAEVTERISAAVNRALESPETRSRLEEQGLFVAGSTREQAAREVEDGLRMWKEFFERATPGR